MKPEDLTNTLNHPSYHLQHGIGLEELLRESFLLDLLPSAVYVCDIEGVIWKYNKKAVELWGRKPKMGDTDERFCGAFRLYNPDGTYLPHDKTPVAATLKDGLPRKDQEVIIERPDNTRVAVNVSIVPIHDTRKNLIGMVNCFHDITEQRKNQKELERKRLELQDYVDNAIIGLHWVNKDGIILWANRAEMKMFGYSAEEYIGHHISEFHANQEKVNDILGRLCRNETLEQFETFIRCKDGNVKTVHINSNVFREDGEFIHTRCFTVDITEQKKYLNALRESELRQRQVFESLPAAVYTCDPFGRITSFNRAAVELWGRVPQIGIDQWCGSWRIYNTDGAQSPLEDCPMAVALKEKTPVRGKEIVVEKPDGTRRNVLPHPTPIFNASGAMTEAVNMLVDITDLRKTEQALRESEDRFRKAADSAPVLFWMANEEGERMFFNKSWQDYVGKKDGVARKNWMKYIHQDDIADYLKHFDRAFASKAEYKTEYRLRKSNGVYRWILEQGVPRYSADGAFEGYFASCIDIEDKKNVTADLEAQVEKRTEELRQANHKLRRYNEQLEQFTYAASHDMKEPLRKIHFYNNYLQQSLGNDIGEKEKEYLNRSTAAAERMQSLIDDLLVYSTTASAIPNMEPVSLTHIVTNVLEAHKVTIEEKNAIIVMDDLPIIRGIAFQMNQLFDNLIGNALKYHHPDRRPQIKIQSKKVSGERVSDPENTYYRISVSDNGIGFDNTYAAQIFNLFHRLHAGSAYPGSGIGLTLCRKIAQNHHGHIEAEAKVNEGAIFSVYLPV